MRDYARMFMVLSDLAVKALGHDNDAYYGYRRVTDYIYSYHVRHSRIH